MRALPPLLVLALLAAGCLGPATPGATTAPASAGSATSSGSSAYTPADAGLTVSIGPSAAPAGAVTSTGTTAAGDGGEGGQAGAGNGAGSDPGSATGTGTTTSGPGSGDSGSWAGSGGTDGSGGSAGSGGGGSGGSGSGSGGGGSGSSGSGSGSTGSSGASTSFWVVRLRGGENATLVSPGSGSTLSCHPYWTHGIDIAGRQLRYQSDRYPDLPRSNATTILLGEMLTFEDCPKPHGPFLLDPSAEFPLGHDALRTVEVDSAGRVSLSGYGSVGIGHSARFTYTHTRTFPSGTYTVEGWFVLEHLGAWRPSEMVADPYLATGTWGSHP